MQLTATKMGSGSTAELCTTEENYKPDFKMYCVKCVEGTRHDHHACLIGTNGFQMCVECKERRGFSTKVKGKLEPRTGYKGAR
jgi:hypothetical protein